MTKSYNSVIYQAIDTNDYYALFADEGFISNKPYDHDLDHYRFQDDAHTTNFSDIYHPYVWQDRVNESTTKAMIQGDAQQYQPLSNADCINAYSQQVLSGRQNLVLITTPNPVSEMNASNIVHDGSLHFSLPVRTNWAAVQTDFVYTQFAPYRWMCSILKMTPQSCRPKKIDPTTWTVNGFGIRSCLSEKVQERCQLALNPTIGVIVILCNVVKFICLLLACLELQEETLTTQG